MPKMMTSDATTGINVVAMNRISVSMADSARFLSLLWVANDGKMIRFVRDKHQCLAG
jgi:hypothetical protein